MPPLPRYQVSLKSFLDHAKRALDAILRQPSEVTFVLGNESADLDSICSAVALAYLRTHFSPTGSLYIPLSNLPRSDLDLRTELVPVLARANLKPSDLITLSDLPPMKTISSRLPPEYTRWILVDHNAMKGEMGKIYGKRLFGCIDHHAEENAVPRDCGAEPRIIRKCGSCTILVVEYCKEAWNARARDNHNEAATYNSELAQMALGPILVDTSNLGNKAETTPADAQAVAYLESWIRSQYDRNEYFRIVSEAKQNIGGLILRDIFRKDYKQYDEGSLTLGVSSITGGIGFLVDKAGGKEKFIGAISDFAKERGVSILSLMTKSNVDGQFARELLVWARDEKGASAAKKFEKDSTETLGLKQWGEGSLDVDEKNNWQRCWWQERVENSRKQVAPLMRNAITPLQRLNAL